MKWKKPSKTQLDAIFHSNHQPIVDTTYGSHSTTVPLYAIASLANNVSLGGRTTSNDAYQLLKALPLTEVSRSLKALPAPILDALKERVFATAVSVGDVDLVSTMLGLNMDPREKIMMDCPTGSESMYPLQLAVAAGHFAVAKTLISNMCRGRTQSQFEDPINHIHEGEALGHRLFGYLPKLNESERTELKCIALRAGARPNENYFGSQSNYHVSLDSLKQLVEATTEGIIAWLEAGLLEHYFAGKAYKGDRRSFDRVLARNVMQFVLHGTRNYHPTSNPKLKIALLAALDAAIYPHNEQAVAMILEEFSLLGYRLNDGHTYTGDLRALDFTHGPFLEAFDNAEWNRAAFLIIAKDSMATSVEFRWTKYPWSELDDALDKDDLSLALREFTLLRPEHIDYEDEKRLTQLAITHHDFIKVVNIIDCLERKSSGMGTTSLMILLQHAQISAVSTLLIRHPVWKSVLEAASGLHNVGPLETLLFHGPAVPFLCFQGKDDIILGQEELQLRFRTLAYHVMATNDFKLCKWLFQLGMDPDEFYLYLDIENRLSILKAPGLHCYLPGNIGSLDFYVDHTLPSLLSVAAGKNHIGWMEFLVTEGVSVVDSMALLWAIKSRSNVATLRFLLEAAKTGKSPVERSSYGVAALRQAIRYRDITRIEVLCGGVNTDGIEPFIEELEKREPAISPLGEAITADDSEMVRLLLKHRASPNAYVSFDGLKMLKHVKSHVQRVSPLLAAIDVQSLPLVKILVEHGAELQYTRNMGITRTPLQRAAETGCFDIVEYLVSRDASIDTLPVYSGGTALQLAAMNGFCGITAFLLEHEADPHYPPAMGSGRTAFEAAAEWGHVDTMSLLMQWKVDLDAQFGEPPESQYERARRFAEKNGFPASKRFVEHLYGQRTRDESWHAGLALDSM